MDEVARAAFKEAKLKSVGGVPFLVEGLLVADWFIA